MAHPPTVVDAIVRELRGRILSGSLEPGMMLPPERELADQLNVSRAALREGLSVLSQMGLISIQRGRGGGSIVTTPPVTTVSSSIVLLFQTRAITARQLVEFRRALEVEAAQLAAAHRSAQELETIASSLEAYIASESDPALQNVRGRAFHYAVVRASGNPLLTETMTSLSEAFAECFALLHTAPELSHLIHALHWPIFDAIRRSHVLDTRVAMLAHFDQLEQVLRDLNLRDRMVGSYIVGDPVALAEARQPETAWHLTRSSVERG